LEFAANTAVILKVFYFA